jgi:hypothetical protein
MVDYAAKLEERGLRPIARGPWAVVGQTNREQGWKLHLSTIPVEAYRLLDVVLPVLETQGTSFKVARDERILRNLNEGSFGATQIGKFLTIYPRTNRVGRDLALTLTRLTRGFAGPVVPTDLRLGDVVYARYGPFSPPALRDRLGHVSSGIRLPNGEVVPHTYAVPFEAPPGRVNPFRDLTHEPESNGGPREGALFGPGYVILDVIRGHPRGSVFLALDARNGRESASLRVLKEGRSHCCSDTHGRDIRSRLKRQAEIAADVAGKVRVPAAGPYFEVAGNGYLPFEYIHGFDLAQEIGAAFGTIGRRRQRVILSRLLEFTQLIGALHAAGYLHRDVKPSNFRVAADESVYMIDLELAHPVGSREAPFGQGTPGFMSPQQQGGEAPSAADDVFGLGASAAFLLTGIHPLRLVFAGRDITPTQLAELAHSGPRGVADTVARCLSPAPERRPSVADVEAALSEAADRLDTARRPARRQRLGTEVVDLLPLAAQGLLHDVCLEGELGLWLSQVPDQSGANPIAAADYGIYRSANRGVAGVVYCLARLAERRLAPATARQRVSDAVDWLLAHAPTADDQLPGLHFGEAGVAVAIAEATRAGLIERGPWLHRYLEEALYGPLDWPDLTHGAAGQGIAAMCCADILEAPQLFDAARRCADFLLASQDPDGGWTAPPGAEGLSGGRLTGFAHGVAGIVYFLCEYAARDSRGDAEQAAVRGAAWLRAQARPSRDGSLEWLTREGGDEVWRWWCHGAPGIALAWLKLFERRGDPRDRQAAVASLRWHPREPRYSNLSTCHGLAGLGEIYLEARRVLGEPEWRSRAERVGSVLLQLARPSKHGVTWLVEDGAVPTGDLMVGCGGVAHFLLRLAADDRLSFPLLP